MSDFLFKDRDGQTPLPQELQKGLKLKHIQTVGELDEFEEKNIAEGLAWLDKSDEDYRRQAFWLKLHKRLFGDVWSWAGKIREHELQNPYFHRPHQIRPELRKLELDLEYWLEKKEMSFSEVAARFHARIETIHPFANGNGRFGRILIEYFCIKEKEPMPTWGARYKDEPAKRRKLYIAALDRTRQIGRYEDLIDFMYC